MAKFLSNRQRSLDVGISSYTEGSGVLTITGNTNISGIVTAIAGAAVTYYGDGSNLTNLPPASVSISTTPPTSPSSGDLWYSPDYARTLIYYNDGSSSQWIDASPFNVGILTVTNFTASNLNVTSGLNVTGVVTATSFVGDGSGLTGLANTAFINAEQVNVVGVVTASSAVFTGNVSIGGTLTYEDVTNVDSVGLITARTGVRVTTGGIEVSAGGLNVTGVSTFSSDVDISGNITSNVTIVSTDAGSSAAPELTLYRNSASPADADYIGQIKFAGESDTGVQRNYAKITGKIGDASNGTEDGILEFAHIKNGSQNISGRWNSTTLQLLNGTDLSVAGDVTATSYYGDGSNLTGLPTQGVGINTAGGSVGTGVTILDFRGAGISTVTVTAGIATLNITGGGGSGSISISTTAPTSPSAGDLWYNPDYGRTLIYYDEAEVGYGTSKQWIDSSPLTNTGILTSTNINTNNLYVTGVATATSFVGSGASLTNIPNSALDNSTVSYGGVQLSLGGSDATPAFDLTDAINYPYSSLTGITTEIVGDTTPQLGGNLDLNGSDITGTGNINITGTATFSGSVSVGGTLTYEDVTNVDSVGLITARSGVRVTTGGIDISAGGLNVTGVTTATSFVKSGGTSSQFLKADGSVDSNTYLTSFTETNDLSSSVTWANVPDANITQSSVTQHQAALSITESQISDLQSYLTDVVSDTTPQLGGNLDLNGSDITGTGNINITGIVTATSFEGDGSNLTGLPTQGVGINTAGGSVGTGVTILDFRGAGISTVTVAAGIATLNIEGGGSGSISISTTAPTSPTSGDLWYSPDYGRTFIYYDEAEVGYGTSKQWVDAAPFNVGILSATRFSVADLEVTNNATVSGIITASSFVKSGGTSSQFLKADGSVDSSTYITSSDNISGTAGGLSGSPSITVADITATGNVSIAGTLTYEDVTNVDSVGLITARSGIHVTGGDVGIGSDSPTEKLDVVQNAADNVISQFRNVYLNSGNLLKFTQTTNGSVTNPVFYVGQGGDNSGNALLLNNANTDMVFYTNNTERMRIGSSGQIGLSGANYGTSGQVITSNGSGSAPTWQDAAGGGSLDFVASGTIANGDTVVINSDGTVSTISGSGTLDQSTGTPTVFNSTIVTYTSAVFDSNSNKVIVAYQDQNNNQYGTAVVGTVSGTSISFGTPVVFNYAGTYYCSIGFDSNSNKVVVAYNNYGNNYYGTAKVGTVSGTSISFGAYQVFEFANTNYFSVTFDSNSNKVIIAYQDSANVDTATVVVGTISGTSISFGTPVAIESYASHISATFDSNSNKVVVAYNGSSGSPGGKAAVGTVSGTSISFGTPVKYSSNSTYTSATFDSNVNKVAIAYRDTNLSEGQIIVGTVSGTSISFGAAVTFHSGNIGDISSTFDSNTGRVLFTWTDSNSYAQVNHGKIVGSSIYLGTSYEYRSSMTAEIAMTFDSNSNKAVIVFRAQPNTYYGTGVVYSPPSLTTNLTDGNFIGIAAQAISNGATGTVNIIGGVNETQTGLTTGIKYYADPTGGLSSEPFVAGGLPTAGVPIITAGTSISSTKLIIKG